MYTKWIFFDCFNTLLDFFDKDGDETGVKPVAHIPVESGYFASTDDFYARYINWRDTHFAQETDEVLLDDRFDRVLSQSDQYPNQIETLIRAMVTRFEETFPRSIRLSPGVEQVLQRYDNKLKMGVVSNFFLNGTPDQLLTQFGLRKYFEFVINSAEEGVKKPAAEIYEIALRKAGVSPEERNRVLFVGDSLKNDVLAPQKIGMQSLHYDRSAERGGDPTPHGIRSISSWEEFVAH